MSTEYINIPQEELGESWVDYIKIAGRVFKDKCWHTIWHFDLFAQVDRMNTQESYYNAFYHVLMMPADKIDDQIYLGSAFNAANYMWLKKHNIEAIVNATECISNYFEGEADFKYYNFGTTDLNNSSLAGHYEAFYRAVKEDPNRKILVHCFAGKSRSAALVLYYLMKEYNWTMERAIKHIRRARPCININVSFLEEIKELLKTQTQETSQIYV